MALMSSEREIEWQSCMKRRCFPNLKERAVKKVYELWESGEDALRTGINWILMIV